MASIEKCWMDDIKLHRFALIPLSIRLLLPVREPSPDLQHMRKW